MRQQKYVIYELSAKAVISYAVQRDGKYVFELDHSSTMKCKNPGATHEQSSNALFHQILCETYGRGENSSASKYASTKLDDAIFYMDFSGIFDVRGNSGRQILRKAKARDMFRPEGITLTIGSTPRRYVAFERSGNMSRNGRLSFIRADLYERVRRRIMLGMHIGQCQLSKLYAYNGLMMSTGVRVEDVGIDVPSRVIVIDNPVRTAPNVNIITVEDDGTQNSTRKYERVEKRADINITCFDGEGLISTQYAEAIDERLCGEHVHTSFQIRLPFVKGMLHQVDFKDFLKNCGTKTITDIWGKVHAVDDVEIILTKSMFKGYGWLKENGMSWEDYWSAFRKYDHALYITQVSREEPESTTELNYQFLTTVSIQAEEYRPSDLPAGWTHSPADDPRHWLTKQTELAYYNFRANSEFRINYFLKHLKQVFFRMGEKTTVEHMASALKKNVLLINEPAFTKILDDKAEQIYEQYGEGRLIVDGDIRYLSGDLLDFLVLLIDPQAKRSKRNDLYFNAAMTNHFPERAFYAPKAVYRHDESCTLLRNPHIARNEELLLSFYDDKNNMRSHYFGHLSDVVMIDSNMLAAERLGGADYDGDMIRTITDPILNDCVRRNYDICGNFKKYESYDNQDNLPLLMIPAAEPLICDADDWEARFDAVSSTFSSRVGQICNAALDRSIIAYNENSTAEERDRCRKEVEHLAIVTGLEIDSAKSGIKPNLDDYLNRRTVKRNLFLQYRTLAEDSKASRRSWYEKKHTDKIKDFLKNTDWSKVDSNVERLPYLAWQMKKHTPNAKAKQAKDSELFSFAVKPDWKDTLDPAIEEKVAALLEDYNTCLKRIRYLRSTNMSPKRKGDVERILFARGQEDVYDTDELYAQFRSLPPQRVVELFGMITTEKWHLMDEDSRERFLVSELPEFADFHDLLSDFRHDGFRLLGDILSDIADENTSEQMKKLTRGNESEEYIQMLFAYAERPEGRNYLQTVSEKCREYLVRIVPAREAVKYLVALGYRDKLWDLVPDAVEKNLLEVRHGK